MKIGILIDRLNVGGVEKIALEEVKALRAIGHDASLVILREKAVVEDAFPDLLKDVPIIYLDKRLPRLLRFSFRFPIFHFFSSFHLTYPRLLPFVVKRGEFDYFISHGTYTTLSAIAIKKRRGIPFSAFIWDPSSYIVDRVYSQEGVSPLLLSVLRKATLALDKYIINNMDVVLVGGEAHNNFIHKVNPSKEIKIIYPSVHPAKKPRSKSDYILVVTAWKKGKNPEYLLEIAQKLPGAHIKMAGRWVDPSYRQEFEKSIDKAGLSEQIEVIGEVSEQQLTKLYGEACMLLQTNDDRGFGMPALEAASQGTTFIIPAGQGVCNLFKDGVDGYFTREKDTRTIVRHLKKLLGNASLASKMGEDALNKVKANYSWERHARELAEIVQKQLSLKKESPEQHS